MEEMKTQEDYPAKKSGGNERLEDYIYFTLLHSQATEVE